MGACIAQRNGTLNSTGYPSTQKPLSQIAHHSQENPQARSPQKKSASKVTADSQSPIPSIAVISQQQDEDDLPNNLILSNVQWQEEANTKSVSVIIKKGTKGNRKQQTSKQSPKDTIKKVSMEQKLEAGCITDRITERFTVSSKEFDIQFTLPRCRAGPLVVPHIDFNQYYVL